MEVSGWVAACGLWHRAQATAPTGAALVLYVMLALAAFYPQSFRPSDTIAYVGDSLESVYLVAWNVHQLFRSPGPLFDANVLYPVPHPLTHTDHRLLPSIVVAPVLWASANPVLAYNVAVLLGSLLAAMAGWSVARGQIGRASCRERV